MIPEIDSDLYESLRSVIKGGIEEYEIEIVNNKEGEGFGSKIIFLTFTHKQTREKIQILVKEELKGSEQSEEEFNILVVNEINFYETIWPFLQKYYNSTSGKDLKVVPKCFGVLKTGRRRIILENLRPQGYVLYDKTKPVDDEHFRTIFKTYGSYHGISMALREQDNEQYHQLVSMQKNMLKKICNDENNPFRKIYLESFRGAQEYFDHVQEKHIVEKLKLYEKSGIDLIRQCLDDDFPQGVILHGDCWSNNLMFKYDEEGKLQNMKMLDFQVVCHGTPVFDLSYSLYSGASGETLNKLDDYLKIYHNSLSDTLKEFGLSAEKVYSLKTLKEEWKSYCKSGFSVSLWLWKLKLCDTNDLPDFTKEVIFNIPADVKENLRKRIRELTFHMYNNDFF